MALNTSPSAKLRNAVAWAVGHRVLSARRLPGLQPLSCFLGSQSETGRPSRPNATLLGTPHGPRTLSGPLLPRGFIPLRVFSSPLGVPPRASARGSCGLRRVAPISPWCRLHRVYFPALPPPTKPMRICPTAFGAPRLTISRPSNLGCGIAAGGPAIPHSCFPSCFNPLKLQLLCPVPADRADSHSFLT